MPLDELEKKNPFFKWKLGSLLSFSWCWSVSAKRENKVLNYISNSPFTWNTAILTVTTHPLLYHENELLCESSHMELRLWEMQDPRDLIPAQLPLTKRSETTAFFQGPIPPADFFQYCPTERAKITL